MDYVTRALFLWTSDWTIGRTRLVAVESPGTRQTFYLVVNKKTHTHEVHKLKGGVRCIHETLVCKQCRSQYCHQDKFSSRFKMVLLGFSLFKNLRLQISVQCCRRDFGNASVICLYCLCAWLVLRLRYECVYVCAIRLISHNRYLGKGTQQYMKAQ